MAAIVFAQRKTNIGPMDDPKQKPTLSPQAQRALAEAEERRRQNKAALPPEKGGPAGPEPTRYGDWERNGIAVDF